MVGMTPELAEICGIHAGDGYLRIREGKVELDLTGHVEERGYYDTHVIPLFNNFFKINLKGKLYVKGTYGFVTTNKGFKLFRDLGFPNGKKSRIVEVPKLILNNKNKVFYARFLRGLFDTDGGLYFSNRKTMLNYSFFKRKYNYYPIIRFTTVSKILSEQVIYLLNRLGFGRVRLHSYQPKDLRESRKYIIYMSGNKILIKFFDGISPKNSVKLSRFQVWRKFGFCPPHTTLSQREDILNGKIDINSIGSYVNG